MQEIKYPTNRNFWVVKDNGQTIHEGITEPNQVTSSGLTLESSEDASDVYPELPESGQLLAGQVYAYQGGMVRIEQDHERTIYPPQQTPALINFFRKETGDLQWIENEQVEQGDERIYDGKKYEALTAHTTLVNWIPPNTPTLWKEAQSEEIPVWKQPTGGHDAYNIGDKVYFPTADDDIYESTIDGNVWSPTALTSGWTKIT